MSFFEFFRVAGSAETNPVPEKIETSRKRKVRFANPPYTNYGKHLTNYSTTELVDVFERFVHIEMLDIKRGKKMSLHKAFHTLFNLYEEWFVKFLHATDRRRKLLMAT
ncbi:hypothetical protein CDAR_126051 [Caerostris darwini]|uniref:LAGLIDADG homing endonuclease n=1 Tax=Caerostris darwini TaxID=1538125 RepID=A0AAV4S8N3_9ARAC|nr:hypothetical protein CDAR_126051 [Caerostris darwini]